MAKAKKIIQPDGSARYSLEMSELEMLIVHHLVGSISGTDPVRKMTDSIFYELNRIVPERKGDLLFSVFTGSIKTTSTDDFEKLAARYEKQTQDEE